MAKQGPMRRIRAWTLRRRVKCKDCGFLGHHSPNNGWSEAHEFTRAKRETTHKCHRQVLEFRPNKISLSRSCKEFARWQPGDSPKEHFQMRLNQRNHKIQIGMGALTILAIVGVGLLQAFCIPNS